MARIKVGRKKMKCKYFDKVNDICDAVWEDCPENTDEDCNVIKPKPKVKVKRVRAWLRRYGHRKELVVTLYKMTRREGFKPCIIEYPVAAKHLKLARAKR